MTARETYAHIHHIERKYHWLRQSLEQRGINTFDCEELGVLVDEIFDYMECDEYKASMYALSWKDEKVSGWVNNDRRMDFLEINARRWVRLSFAK